MARDGRKRWIVALGATESQLLEQWAAAEERCPDQQATWLIRRALESVELIETSVEPSALPGPGVAPTVSVLER
jgi:hypothetical protein